VPVKSLEDVIKEAVKIKEEEKGKLIATSNLITVST